MTDPDTEPVGDYALQSVEAVIDTVRDEDDPAPAEEIEMLTEEE